jgi:hypothetical protein
MLETAAKLCTVWMAALKTECAQAAVLERPRQQIEL